MITQTPVQEYLIGMQGRRVVVSGHELSPLEQSVVGYTNATVANQPIQRTYHELHEVIFEHLRSSERAEFEDLMTKTFFFLVDKWRQDYLKADQTLKNTIALYAQIATHPLNVSFEEAHNGLSIYGANPFTKYANGIIGKLVRKKILAKEVKGKSARVKLVRNVEYGGGW